MIEPAPDLPEEDVWGGEPYNLYVEISYPGGYSTDYVRRSTSKALRKWGIPVLISTEQHNMRVTGEDSQITVVYEIPVSSAIAAESKAGGASFELYIGDDIYAIATLEYLPSQMEPDRIAGEIN